MARLILKEGKKDVMHSNYIAQCSYLAIGSGLYGVILFCFGLPAKDSTMISVGLILSVFFTLIINFVFIKSSFLFNLLNALTGVLSITLIFLSAAIAYSLGYFNEIVVIFYILTVSLYVFLEVMEFIYMPMSKYINLLRENNVISQRKDGNINYQIIVIGFYRSYFDKLQFPLSHYLKLINSVAVIAILIAVPFGQQAVYARPDNAENNSFFIAIFVSFCIGFLWRHHFANLGMIYRLDKALKRGDITPEDIFKSNI
jgi:hypothetical protein